MNGDQQGTYNNAFAINSDIYSTNTSDDSYDDPSDVAIIEQSFDEEEIDEEEYEEVDEVYDQNNKELLNSPYVRGVIMAVWDNTMGPRAIRVWHGLGTENKLDDDIITFVSRFTVIDEISREEEINSVELKFNVLKDAGIIVLTTVFCAKHNRSKTVFTLSTVMSRDMLTKFMTLNHIMKDKVMTLTKLLQTLCNEQKGDMTMVLPEFETPLREFIQLFDHLNRTGLPPFKVENTLLYHHMMQNNSPSNSKDEFDFLARAITSHLETHCYSVVIGLNVREIDQWVNTMSLFLLPHERPLCRSAQKTTFVPELFVQGIVLPSNDKSVWKQVIPIGSVLSGRYPITVIDLHQKIVRSFRKYNAFKGLKREYFESDIQASPFVSNMNGMGVNSAQFRRNANLITKNKNQDLYLDHFIKSNDIAVSVQKLLEVIFGGDSKKKGGEPCLSSSIRVGYVLQYMQHLNRRALCLAKYVDQVLSMADQSRLSLNMIVNDDDLRLAVLDMKKNSGIPLASARSELYLVLAMAEKLIPGTYVPVAGDPEVEADNVIDFFDEL